MLVDDQYMPMDAVTEFAEKCEKSQMKRSLMEEILTTDIKIKSAGKIISSTIEEYWWIALKRTKVILGPDKLN